MDFGNFMVYGQVLVGFVLLLGGAEFLVHGAVAVASKAGLSRLLIGMTVVALGTSAPEFVVSLNAALEGSTGLAMGNVIGSNIANLWLILGGTALVAPIIVDTRAVIRDALMLMGSTLLFAWLCLNGTIGQVAGGVMILALVLYFVRSYIRERGHAGASSHLREREADEVQVISMKPWLAWASLLAGIAAVAYGAELLVSGGTHIARNYGISEEVIGLTLIAFGTSLPELAASVVAALRGHTDVAIGNVIGSNLFNILAVAGGVAIIVPLHVPQQLIQFDLWVMLGATVMVLTFLALGMRFGRRFGVAFLGLYGGYIATQVVGVDHVLAYIG